MHGVSPTVFAYKGVDKALCAEMGAVPFFDIFAYWASDGDPISGQLNAFHISAEVTHKNLSGLSNKDADLIYFNSVRPPQFLAILLWLARIPPERMPHVVVEFGTEPGLTREKSAKGVSYVIRDPRIDPRALFYRFAANRIPKSANHHLHLITFEKTVSQVYSALLNYPVGVAPVPIRAAAPLRRRANKRPITVSVLGHQRPEKGYHLMPDVIPRLLNDHPEICFLAHNGAPAQMPESQKAIRGLACKEPRLIVDERVATPDIWRELIEASNLILCPYSPEGFHSAHSFVGFEALANAIPFVGPIDTFFHRLIQQFNGCGAIFDRFDSQSISEGVGRALSHFDELADIAFKGAEEFARLHGPQRVAEEILRFAATTTAGA
jgi:hypothetical protein